MNDQQDVLALTSTAQQALPIVIVLGERGAKRRATPRSLA